MVQCDGAGTLPNIRLSIDTIGSTKTAIFGALEPLTAVILGIIILGEALSLNTAIGMLLILVSVTVLTIKK